MSDMMLLGLVTAAALIGAFLICKIEKRPVNRKLHVPRCKVGEVLLTEQGVNYLVGRMRDRIMQLTDENERLQREIRERNQSLTLIIEQWRWENFNEKTKRP